MQSRTPIDLWLRGFADDIQNEIVMLGKSKDVLFSEKEASLYARQSSFEFFAEAFVALELGEPSVLKEAMEEYLRQKGML